MSLIPTIITLGLVFAVVAYGVVRIENASNAKHEAQLRATFGDDWNK
jgi:hypothetical protein